MISYTVVYLSPGGMHYRYRCYAPNKKEAKRMCHDAMGIRYKDIVDVYWLKGSDDMNGGYIVLAIVFSITSAKLIYQLIDKLSNYFYDDEGRWLYDSFRIMWIMCKYW